MPWQGYHSPATAQPLRYLHRVMRLTAAALLCSLSLLACDGGSGDGDGLQDADGDGYRSTDCDDQDPTAHPGAEEVCDGADNDCDGEVDEDTEEGQTLYADDDRDGYGDPATPRSFCADPGAGWADNFEDCDDASADNSPDAEEVCDGIDNDCDGLVDDSDESLARGDWTFDGDGDGYGGDLLPARCSYISGYVLEGGDCDDEDDTLSPGVDEVCDGVDNDCDGLVDADDLSAADAAYYHADADGDGYGSDVDRVFSCEVIPGAILRGGDCDDSDPTIYADALEDVDNGRDDNCNLLIDEHLLRAGWGLRRGEAAGDRAGHSLAALGDIDGDAAPDVAVGAPGADLGGEDAGAVYVFSAAALAASPEGGLAADATAVLIGEAAGDRAGWSLGGGDIDGDGYSDVLVGAPENDGDGGVFVLHGPVTGEIGLGDADIILGGSAAGEEAGWRFDVRDIDLDGKSDLLVGAPGRDADDGLAYLIEGDRVIEASMGAIDTAGLSDSGGGRAGAGVSLLGDINGDGAGDVMVGAPERQPGGATWQSGAAYGLYGGIFGNITLSSQSDFVVQGESGLQFVGAAVLGPGDLDNDGYDDMLIGAPGVDYGHIDGGLICVLYGRATQRSGSISLSRCDAQLLGTHHAARFGEHMARAGRLNRDGRADVLLGAPGYEIALVEEVGAALLLYGDAFSGTEAVTDVAAPIFGSAGGVEAGAGLAAPGDLDGDGRRDVMVGAPGAGDGAGQVYFLTPPY